MVTAWAPSGGSGRCAAGAAALAPVDCNWRCRWGELDWCWPNRALAVGGSQSPASLGARSRRAAGLRTSQAVPPGSGDALLACGSSELLLPCHRGPLGLWSMARGRCVGFLWSIWADAQLETWPFLDITPANASGQHWLKDESVLQRIVAAAGLQPVDHVLEVGPGRASTAQLLASPRLRAGCGVGPRSRRRLAATLCC